MCPNYGCANYGGKVPAGCVAIAIAQSLAYINKYSISEQFNLTAIRKIEKVWASDPLATEVAQFIVSIADGVKMNFGCDGSGSTFDKSVSYLETLGLENGIQMIAEKTAGVNGTNLITSAYYDYPVLSFGDNGKEGHAWIFNGAECDIDPDEFRVPPTCQKLYQIYCNYGWSGRGDGWYASYNLPIDQLTHEPLTSSPYNKNNAYIYFKYSRRW